MNIVIPNPYSIPNSYVISNPHIISIIVSFQTYIKLSLDTASTIAEHIKGQLISEWLFDVLNFPKKTTQKFNEFLP
jgi:hypothetical protein